MVGFVLMIISACFLIYGGLVTSGKFTPVSSKILIEDENRAEWCKTEGVAKILWGLDIAFFTMYYQGIFMKYLWLICFLCLTVYIIYLGYKNNQKYMK